MDEDKGYKVQGYSVMTEEEKKNLYIDGYEMLVDEDKKLCDKHMRIYQSRNTYEVTYISVRKPNKKDNAPNACLVVSFEKQGYKGFNFVDSSGEYF